MMKRGSTLVPVKMATKVSHVKSTSMSAKGAGVMINEKSSLSTFEVACLSYRISPALRSGPMIRYKDQTQPGFGNSEKNV